MPRRFFPLLALAAALQAQPAQPHAGSPVHEAFARLYNFDFEGAHRILDAQIQKEPARALPFSVKAAAFLYSELNRLRILELDFFSSDDKVIDRRKLTPDPAVRKAFQDTIAAAERTANARLAKVPDDREALFALCMTTGLNMDYAALVERRRLGSYPLAKKTQACARRLLELNPPVWDASMTYGTIEYVVGSMPFFIRWFVRFDQIKGSKEKAVQQLEQVAQKGEYYGPLARVMLAVIHVREKRPARAAALLSGLSRDYPQNELFKKELARAQKLAAARAK